MIYREDFSIILHIHLYLTTYMRIFLQCQFLPDHNMITNINAKNALNSFVIFVSFKMWHYWVAYNMVCLFAKWPWSQMRGCPDDDIMHDMKMYFDVSERPSTALRARVPMGCLWCPLLRERSLTAKKALMQLNAPLTFQQPLKKKRYLPLLFSGAQRTFIIFFSNRMLLI